MQCPLLQDSESENLGLCHEPEPEQWGNWQWWWKWLRVSWEGEQALLKMLVQKKALQTSQSSAAEPSEAECSGMSSWSDVADSEPESAPDAAIPELLEKIEGCVKGAFEDTRILIAQPDFIQEVCKTPFQLILNHACVVLGPSGAGKTTLVNHLTGSKFRSGPQAEDKTSEAQSCDLQLEGLPDDLNVVVIDTPGWSHETSANIKSEYKKVLKEKELVSEHTPHIILFCVSVSTIRQFQEKEAEKMSKQLEDLRFDKRFPIKVLPVATCGDSQTETQRLECMTTIKKMAEKAFVGTLAEVEDPTCTMFSPSGVTRGVAELKDRIKDILHDQIHSDEFRGLAERATAKSLEENTKAHAEQFPENDSALRLFQRAFTAAASICEKEVSDWDAFQAMTKEMDLLPWHLLPMISQAEPEIPLSESLLRLWNHPRYHFLGFLEMVRGDGKRVSPPWIRKWMRSRSRLQFGVCFLLLLSMGTFYRDHILNEETKAELGRLQIGNEKVWGTLHQKEAALEDMTNKFHAQHEKLDSQTAKLQEKEAALTDMTNMFNAQHEILDSRTAKLQEKEAALADMANKFSAQHEKLDSQTAELWQTEVALDKYKDRQRDVFSPSFVKQSGSKNIS